MPEIDPQQFGELKATVAQLEKTMENTNTDMRELRAAIKELTDQLSQAKGGWKVLLAVASIGAALASLADWAVSHMTLRP
jgi:phage shock protein A